MGEVNKKCVVCVFVCVYACMSTPHSLMTGTTWQSSRPSNAQRQYSTRWPLQRSQVSPKLRMAEVSLSTQYTEKTHTGTQNIHVKHTESHYSRRSSNYVDREEHKNSDVKWCWLWWCYWQEKTCTSVIGLTGSVKGRWWVLDMNYQKHPSRWLPLRLTSVKSSSSFRTNEVHLQQQDTKSMVWFIYIKKKKYNFQ